MPAAPRSSPYEWPQSRWRVGLLALVAATFLLRSRYFGNPFLHVDEEFYLLVGDRMLHGAVPYVDIWDRKPVGLFLIYAAIRFLGGAGIVQYQLVAAAFAAGTAMIVAMIARRIAPPVAALAAGLAYVGALPLNAGQGGQSPIFYNLLIASGGLLLMRLIGTHPSRERVRWTGAAIMLLVGLAMQIKYSPIFEGLYFGAALIIAAWRAAPKRHASIAVDALLWSALALLPTASAYGWYAAHGYGDQFLFANFRSIGLRGAVQSITAVGDMNDVLKHLAVTVIPLVIGGSMLVRRGDPKPWPDAERIHDQLLLLAGWAAAAAIGLLSLGTVFDHYVLPLLVPLSIMLAPCFAVRPRPAGAVIAAVTLGILLIPMDKRARNLERTRGDATYARQLVEVIKPRLKGGCLYVFTGQPILYHLTGSCLPTRWAFPYHLAFRREAPALGVEPAAEVRRIFAARPAVVVDNDSRDTEVNPTIAALVHQELMGHYKVVFAGRHPRNDDIDRVWARKD